MNRIYRNIWSRSKKAIVVVSENAKTAGKSNGTSSTATVGALVAGGMFAIGAGSAFASPPANALPSGYQVSAGAAGVSTLGNKMTVQQSSQNAAINWQSFSIGSSASVNFVQPNTSAITLNRVVGTEQSVISGALNANGKVFLLNSNGVLFTQGASVNTGGLVASTLNISDADFMAGRSTFTSSGSHASVINLGTINVTDGGYVALLGNQVSNQGVITAKLGTAVLAAGDQISLNFNGDSLVGVTINQGTLNALVENKQAIYADGGMVTLTAKGLDSVLASAVNNTGEIRAQTVSNQSGKIYLLAEGGTVNVNGTLDASAPVGAASAANGVANGGFIETSGAHVNIADTAKITTAAASGLNGTWLIDPVDFTIAASGGNITGAALGTALNSNSVTIQTATGGTSCTGATCTAGSTGTNGDINVNDTVSWSGNYTLTLNAYGNININKTITASGTTGALALYYGQGAVNASNTATYNVNAPVNLMAGSNFSTKLGSDGSVVNYTVITSLGVAADATTAPGTMTLQGMNQGLTGNYVLGANIDATATSTWNANAGFTPVGNTTSTLTQFRGKFDGLGHTISNLSINRAGMNFVGLFGYATSASVIQNVGMVGGSVSGSYYTGELVGQSNGTISNSYATGSVSGNTGVGGLMGGGNATISNSYATGNVSAGFSAGGLVGDNGGTISNSHATGSVTGTSSYIGGLVGWNMGTINTSYATGSVSGTNNIGGLVGGNTGTGTINTSYATGNASGTQATTTDVGGLVGLNAKIITNSYATGSASGVSDIGGLVGHDSVAASTITNSYATGSVSGTTYVGGLVGYQQAGTNTNSYWNSSVNATGIGSGATTGATGLTTSQMQSAANFTGFDFTTPIWGISPTRYSGLPYLSNVTVGTSVIYLDVLTGSSVYGSTPSFTYGYYTTATYGSGTLVTDATPTGTIVWTGAPTASSNVGSYSVAYSSGITLGNSGYILTAGTAVNWSVTPASLTVTASNASKTYGQTPTLTAFTSSGLVNGESIGGVTETSSGISATAAASGSPYDITPSAATGGTFSAGNYTITYVNGKLTVNAAAPTAVTPVITPAIANVITNATVVQTTTNTPSRIETPITTVSPSGERSSGGQANSFVNVVTPMAQLNTIFGNNTQLSIISSPNANEPTQVVSLSQARDMMQPVSNSTAGNSTAVNSASSGLTGNVPGGASGGAQSSEVVGDVRVPVSRNSLAEIVNGGVKLPTGLEQELFVVKSN